MLTKYLVACNTMSQKRVENVYKHVLQNTDLARIGCSWKDIKVDNSAWVVLFCKLCKEIQSVTTPSLATTEIKLHTFSSGQHTYFYC